MSVKRIVGIMLVVLGVMVLIYSGITIKLPGKPVNIGPIHVETTDRHFIPPIAGVIALACGVVLLVVGRKS